MAGIEGLISSEEDGTLSFGDYELTEKTKKADFEHDGDLYNIKTYDEITKLERNGVFVYESVPGTAVRHFKATGDGIFFEAEGAKTTQITLGMEDDAQYRIFLQGADVGTVKTGIGGKLALSVDTRPDSAVSVKVEKI